MGFGDLGLGAETSLNCLALCVDQAVFGERHLR